MTLRPGWLAWLVGVGWLVTSLGEAIADEPAPSKQAPPEQREPVELDDAPEKLKAAPASEAQQDRLHAATLFAQGRILNQRGKTAEALSKYERAWRYDQDSKTILEELVPLAARLNRTDEAARYAVIAVEKGAKLDPRVLQRLAMSLSQAQEWNDALVLYQQVYDLQKQGQGDDEPADVSMVLVQLELGRIHFLLGEYKESAAAFAVVRDALEHPDKYNLNDALRKMVLDDPERTYLLLGESFLRGGRLDDAEAMFRKADELKPQPEVLAFRLARVAAERGQTDAALEQLEKYLAAKSSLAGGDPYELLAELLRKKHTEEKEAQAALVARIEKLYNDDPANAGLASFAAEIFLQADRLEDAEKVYREQLTLNPTAESYRGLIQVYRKLDQPAKLLEVLGQAAAEDGSLDSYEDEVAEIAEDDKLLDRVIAAATDEKLPVEGVALAAGLLALEGGKVDAANKFLSVAAQRNEPGLAAVLTAWGLGLFVHGEFEKAAEIFQRCIDEEVNPENDAAYYFYLANTLAFANRPDEALTAALQAQQLRPENPQFESRVAWINYRAQRYGAAERGYLDLLAKVEEDYNSAALRELVRETKLVLSNICVQQDRFEDGAEWLEQVLDEFPRDPGALNDLGYLWAEKGAHPQRALRMVRQAVEAEPDNAAYQDSLGWALFQVGRTDEALKHLEKAIELQGESPDGMILDHLGDVYQKLDQRDKAQDAWRRAAAAFEKTDDTDSQAKVKKKLAP